MYVWYIIDFSCMIFPEVAGITEYIEQAMQTCQAAMQHFPFFLFLVEHTCIPYLWHSIQRRFRVLEFFLGSLCYNIQHYIKNYWMHINDILISMHHSFHCKDKYASCSPLHIWGTKAQRYFSYLLFQNLIWDIWPYFSIFFS